MGEAKELDKLYPNNFRGKFHIPTFKSMGLLSIANEVKYSDNSEVTYLVGNSLGLMPKCTEDAVLTELNAWRDRGVDSHFRHPTNTSWVDIDLPVIPLMARLVGAMDEEVAIMNSLTANLNALLVAFYKPTEEKFKILFEKSAFPSDYCAFYNQCLLHGLDPESSLVQLSPRPGEAYLRIDDIFSAVDENKESLSLVCLPGIQYYSGQFFDIETITKYVHQFPNIIVGWDLAHAVGNVPLQLHDWGVDFACWCSYKYLNGGPGGIGGLFVNEKFHNSITDPEAEKNTINSMPRLAGWWGNNKQKRFQMLEQFDPIPGALGFRQSNPSVLDVVSLKSSLVIFHEYGGIQLLRDRSIKLTSYLIDQLMKSKYYHSPTELSKFGFKIITPIKNDKDHGAQVSLLFSPSDRIDKTKDTMEQVFSYMHAHGVIVDERRPSVIRISPAPLYNTFQDIFQATTTLEAALDTLRTGAHK